MSKPTTLYDGSQLAERILLCLSLYPMAVYPLCPLLVQDTPSAFQF